MTAPAPDPLAVLDAAGRRLRRAALTAGAAKTLAVAAAAALAVAAADAFGGGFDGAGLRAARWTIAGLTAAAALRWLVGPLLRRPDRAVIAAATDRFGGGNDRWAAALSSPAASAGPLRSRLLAGAPSAPPAPRRGRLRWAVAALLLCGATVGAWLVVAPSTATAAAARLTGTAGREPLRFEVAGRLVPWGQSEIRLAAGTETMIRAVGPGGESPRGVRWRAAGATPTPVEPGVVRLPIAATPATLAASADGFRSALITVRPLNAPTIERFRVTVQSPGRPPAGFDSPTAVTAEPGDRVRAEIVASPSAEVRLIAPPEGPQIRPDEDGWAFRRLSPGDWPVSVALVPRERPFASSPSSADDAAGESPRPLFTLRVQRDAPPTVTLVLPEKNATVTPTGAVAIEATAEDDRPALRLDLLTNGEVRQTGESGEERTAAVTAVLPIPVGLPTGGTFAVSAAATDARGQRTETPPRTVRVVSPEEKRAELEAAVPPPAAALQRAADAAEALRKRVAKGQPVDPAEVRRTLDRLDADFAEPVRDAIADAERNEVPPGPRLAAASTEERDALPAVRTAADDLRTALREAGADRSAAAAELSKRLSASAGRLGNAIAAAKGAETAEALREDQTVLTDRTAAAVRDPGANAAGLADEQRAIASALGALRDGPAAESLRAAARELAAGRLTEAVARQREALNRWNESPGAEASPAAPSNPEAALTDLAARQRTAATTLRAMVDDGLSGRRALRELRRVEEEETALAERLTAFAASADPVTAAAVGASAEEVRTVAKGAGERRDADALLPLAERAAARLEALAGGPGDAPPESPTDAPEDGSPGDEAPADAAALARWQRFLRERTLAEAPDLPSLAAEQRALAAAPPAESPVAATAGEAADRLQSADPAAAAERQAAVLELLATMGGEALAAATSPESSPEPPTASPTEPEPGTLPDAGTEDAAAAGIAGSSAGAGGSAGGAAGPGAVADGANVPWGRLPPRLRERLADAADAPAAPGFAELTARYRARLAGATDSNPSSSSFAPPPSPSVSPPSNASP